MSAHIRHGFGSVRPYLHGPLTLLEFLNEVFGAALLERHDFTPESCHAELRISDSVVVVEAGALPDDVPPWTCSVSVYVEDVDATFDRALRLGATPIAEPADKPYGERQAGFRDGGGNTWWVGTFGGTS